MDTKKQNIHYCTILSSEQWIFLLEGKSSVNRYKCLYRLMSETVRTKTVYSIKGIEIALEVGQVATSDVELAEYLGCNRKTIGKLIDSFNRLGMLTTKTNNRTSIHTLHFLTGWYVDGVLLTIPIMSDLRLPPKDRRAIYGHLPPTHLFLLVGNVMTNGMNRKRTAQSATHSLFLLPSVRLKLPTCHLRTFLTRKRRTIPIS